MVSQVGAQSVAASSAPYLSEFLNSDPWSVVTTLGNPILMKSWNIYKQFSSSTVCI